MSSPKTYTPALRFHRLTGAYDWVLSRTMPEKAFKSALLRQASIAPGHCVLDFGCGTGTLTLMAQAAVQEAQIMGVDVDEGALNIARAKAASANSAVTFLKISSGPFEDQSFDRVLSCLVFHHLRRDEKVAALAECRRVLRPSGEIHIADWGLPGSSLLRAGFFLTQLLDGFDTTRDNVLGHLPALLSEAGFVDVVETGHFPTVFGSLRLLRGTTR